MKVFGKLISFLELFELLLLMFVLLVFKPILVLLRLCIVSPGIVFDDFSDKASFFIQEKKKHSIRYSYWSGLKKFYSSQNKGIRIF